MRKKTLNKTCNDRLRLDSIKRGFATCCPFTRRYTPKENMRNIALTLTLMFLSTGSFATAFSMGTGEHWIEMCTGKSTAYPGNTEQEVCYITMLSYQVGALTQALEFNKSPTLCSNLSEEELAKGFVAFIQADSSRKSQNFLELYPSYLRGLDDCEV